MEKPPTWDANEELQKSAEAQFVGDMRAIDRWFWRFMGCLAVVLLVACGVAVYLTT